MRALLPMLDGATGDLHVLKLASGGNLQLDFHSVVKDFLLRLGFISETASNWKSESEPEEKDSLCPMKL